MAEGDIITGSTQSPSSFLSSLRNEEICRLFASPSHLLDGREGDKVFPVSQEEGMSVLCPLQGGYFQSILEHMRNSFIFGPVFHILFAFWCVTRTISRAIVAR